MLFSLAMVVINIRTPLLLGRTARQRGGNTPVWAMTVLFSVLVVWMAARFVILLFAAPPPPDLRGANPTQWLTVFGYIVIMSMMSVSVMWMEVNSPNKSEVKVDTAAGKLSGFIEYFRNKLLLLWSAVTVLIVTVVSMLGIGYVNLRDVEKSRLIHNVELVNDALVEHTLQLSSQVDTILRSVRGYYLHTQSIKATESFINTLGFDRSVIDNIYLIGSDGKILITHDTVSLPRSAADREYFKFHLATAADRMFISEVEPGRITGKPHFRITRRINNPDGSFGGLVLATVNPESFASYYRHLRQRSDGFASLIGISDRKLRARVPDPAAGRWSEQVVSPLWDVLKKTPTGRYENTSQFDNIRRLFVYKKVGALPLVVVTGFSHDDLKDAVRERMSLLVLTLISLLVFTLLLALLLTIESKRRDDLRHAGELLKRSEQRLREAQAVARIGDWEFDPKTGMISYSEQMYELTKRDPGAGPPHISEAVAMFHPDDLPDVERYFRVALETGAGWQHDVRVILPDGQNVWHRGTGKTVTDEQGNVIKIYGTTQEITKDKLMEWELQSLNENLTQKVRDEIKRRLVNESLLIQRSKQADMGEMIGAIAHQWRQPLATVGVIFQNLLSARKMNKLDEGYLEKASTDATALIRHMSETIDSFRNYFKPEKTKELFNVIEKIEEAIDFIRAQLHAYGITVTLPDNNDPHFNITGFPNEFTQVILNLIANAKDAILDKSQTAHDGTNNITVTVRAENSLLIIEVCDSGCGIPPDAVTRIFDPYFTTKEEGHGTGIGLYMSRLIIEESMGGKMTFTSKPGETIFRMELPHV